MKIEDAIYETVKQRHHSAIYSNHSVTVKCSYHKRLIVWSSFKENVSECRPTASTTAIIECWPGCGLLLPQ